MENVDGVDGGLSGLFISEDQVDPLVDLAGDLCGFERLSVDADEQSGIFSRTPGRQFHVANCRSALAHSQIQT